MYDNYSYPKQFLPNLSTLKIINGSINAYFCGKLFIFVVDIILIQRYHNFKQKDCSQIRFSDDCLSKAIRKSQVSRSIFRMYNSASPSIYYILFDSSIVILYQYIQQPIIRYNQVLRHLFSKLMEKEGTQTTSCVLHKGLTEMCKYSTPLTMYVEIETEDKRSF